MNSIIGGLREYIITCPLLDENGRVGVDFLSNETVEYVIESTPAEPVLQMYVDGGSKRQYLFVFASREWYGADELGNMSNCGFYEAFAEWLEAQDKINNFPQLPDGKMSIGIKATTHGYLFDAETDTGRYQIQCQLIYVQEA